MEPDELRMLRIFWAKTML